VIPTFLLRGGIEAFDRARRQHRWHFPLILKPDVGQRGAGVRLVHTHDEVAEYLSGNSGRVLVQPYHAGPLEAGIFYYRIPGEARGHILSITDKHFAQVVGDGESTLEQLIWKNPRLRMQANTFLARHADEIHRALGTGETLRLVVAGNHCQGTMYRDGSHLITPQLERKIDQIAQTMDGFFFGRFDVRYSDVERFKAGEDLAIIELNGVTSESTNLYDPTWSLWRAYRTLFTQWSLLFQIGAANRRNGFAASRAGDLLIEIVDHFKTEKALAD
jgi:hypothetical protein